MSAFVGSRIYKATKLYTCEHCAQRIELNAKYLRFWQKPHRREPICLLCAVTTFNIDTGQRVYACLPLDEYIATAKKQQADVQLVRDLERGIMAAAIAVDGHHAAVDFMRGFALGLRRALRSK
jgi:hypothetical protein